MHPIHHAKSSKRKFGGEEEDYLPIHEWFDETKAWIPGVAHRAIRHHSQGIFECERVFGSFIVNSSGKKIPTRVIGEQHVKEDCGWIPTAKDWLEHLSVQEWMIKVGLKSKELE